MYISCIDKQSEMTLYNIISLKNKVCHWSVWPFVFNEVFIIIIIAGITLLWLHVYLNLMSDQDRFSPYNTNVNIKQASDKKEEKHQFGDY